MPAQAGFQALVQGLSAVDKRRRSTARLGCRDNLILEVEPEEGYLPPHDPRRLEAHAIKCKVQAFLGFQTCGRAGTTREENHEG